ncbi:MAG: Si-specific NAD(P)(+) transhydrogenase [Planctomycetes bacterium]|nr:Si-specific NAD(P)(+) transhydrogenase [Planctomycetota bacterium]
MTEDSNIETLSGLGNEAKHYDLVVIGSGPAGEKGAAQAAYFGKSVALIERESILGGAAANTGTLPSKTLRETALTLAGFKSRELYGVDLSLRREATVRDFMFHEERVAAIERKRVEKNIEKHKVEHFHGFASFVDPHTVRAIGSGGAQTFLRGDVILIATGSSPRMPDEVPKDDPRVYDSDTILKLGGMPKSIVVIGGGVIGCEYACTFSALGIEATLIHGGDRILPFLDVEISGALAARMHDRLGIRMMLNSRLESCEPKPDALCIKVVGGESFDTEALLVAAGRTSNVGALNLPAAGVETGKYGVIAVNEHYRTNVPHIYAAGDVIGFPALASTSMEQARVAMCEAFELTYKDHLAPILPYGIYTIPEVSMAGDTEEQLKEKGVDYVVGRASYNQNARGVIIGDTDGFLKLLFRSEDMRLLGIHVVGEIASELVHIGLIALLVNATSDLFIQTCFNYPTLGELYKYATYDALGKRKK